MIIEIEKNVVISACDKQMKYLDKKIDESMADLIERRNWVEDAENDFLEYMTRSCIYLRSAGYGSDVLFKKRNNLLKIKKACEIAVSNTVKITDDDVALLAL